MAWYKIHSVSLDNDNIFVQQNQRNFFCYAMPKVDIEWSATDGTDIDGGSASAPLNARKIMIQGISLTKTVTVITSKTAPQIFFQYPGIPYSEYHEYLVVGMSDSPTIDTAAENFYAKVPQKYILANGLYLQEASLLLDHVYEFQTSQQYLHVMLEVISNNSFAIDDEKTHIEAKIGDGHLVKKILYNYHLMIHGKVLEK